MRLLKVAIAIAIVFVNLLIAQPSWADRPKFSKNPDYIEVTKTIKELKKVLKVQSPQMYNAKLMN